MFFFPFFCSHCHLKCSQFTSEGWWLQGFTFPWRLDIVTVVSRHYWQPLCHPCTPVTHWQSGYSEDTGYWPEREHMDVLSVYWVYASMSTGWSLHACVCVCVLGWICVHENVCVCPHSVSQLSLQSVYVWLQGKSSSKKWILTRRAPYINSLSHSQTQKTTYLHCISPGTPFSFWWWFRNVEISPWTSERNSETEIRRKDTQRNDFRLWRGGIKGRKERLKLYSSGRRIICLPTFKGAHS